ncbi:acyltransferase family protein [Sphaerotilus sp.]|uniref:acyltransferase family protein n=1 Tax=Sphaerotilus sp. TaxID=2093942 RepID=UPI0025CD50A8|nr:acyltransferase [Sphaerotilus sp.]
MFISTTASSPPRRPTGSHRPAAPADNASKLSGLELIRFISAIAVLVWHYQHFYYVADLPVGFVRQDQPFYAVLRLFYAYGFSGVQVFWCVSGYIFFWKYGQSIHERTLDFRKFLLFRFSRLYPLHLVTLLLVWAMQGIYFNTHQSYFVYPDNDLYHFVLQLFMASDWGFQKGYSFNGPIWSISLEILVYLLFFLTVRCFGPSPLVSVVLVAVGGAAVVAKVAHPVFGCMASFYLGGLTATGSRSVFAKAHQTLLKIMLLTFLVAAPVLAMTTGLGDSKYIKHLFILLYTPALLYYMAEFFKVPNRLQKTVLMLGNVTYSSYLVHFPIQLSTALVCFYIGQPVPAGNPLFFLAFMGFTLCLAVLTYQHFEMPAQSELRISLSTRRTPRHPSASAPAAACAGGRDGP